MQNTFLKYIGLSSIVWIAIQLTDLKAFGVKPIEIIGLYFLIVNCFKVSKLELFLIGFFSFFILVTFICNHYQNFPEIDYGSNVKQQYIISIARYLEYLSCIGIVLYVRDQIRDKSEQFVIKSFLATTIVFESLIVVFYIFQYLGIQLFEVAYPSQGFLRLKGFFVEGGPFGLFNAFLLILTFQYVKSNKRYILALFFILLILLAKSKAGFVSLIISALVWLIIELRLYFQKRSSRLILYVLAAFFFIITFYLISSVYVNSLLKKEELVEVIKMDPNNFWINGGRIPGFFIVQEMISSNFVFGIGMGNYQLLRNSSDYLTFFPVTVLWDYHGFGGITDLVVEFGLVGFVLFLLGFFYLFKNVRHYLFLLPFLLGLPLYFHYPYIIFATIDLKYISFNKTN